MKKLGMAVAVLASLQGAFAEIQGHEFGFYGKTVSVQVDKRLLAYRFSNTALCYSKVSSQLKAMHAMGLNATFTDLESEAGNMYLDNLGYFQLLKAFSIRVFPEQTPEFRIALVWYGLRHKGIDALLAGKNDYLNLFVRMEQETDGGFSLTHLGKKYYSVTKGEIPFRALEVFRLPLLQDSAYGEISLNMSRLPELGEDVEYRTREFRYENRDYVLETRYNSNLVAYMNDLPRFRIGTHLYEVRPSTVAYNSLNDSLIHWMRDMDDNEKLNFLLAMVQKAFPYKADREYRANEKRNFVEQTLADDYVDCEDKAALFCFLVREYLHAKTILIYSESKVHVNCAIQLPSGAPGYTFKYKNRPYLVCEPSYSGYNAGETDMTLNEFKNAEVFE